MKLSSTLQEQLAALAADEGLELISTEVVGNGPKTILRLIVDGADGVGLDRCSSVSRQASAMLDVEDPFDHPYTLEISSPGLDRKLYSLEEYRRFVGRRVKIRMQPSYRQHRQVIGDLLGVRDEVVRLVADDGTELELPLEDIFEARLEVDWKSVMKEGKSRP
ncbi:MAG: ribosome maturation factor RimP [Thermoanaerobaculales bacterium]